MGDWGNWLIIIAVVALAVGPVMMFQPSAGQRKLAKFRALANEKGLRVRLAGGNVSELKGTALYALPWQHKALKGEQWSLIFKGYDHDLHLLQRWACEGVGDPGLRALLLAQLPALPATVSGVSAGPEGLGVNWSERGSLEELLMLINWLTDLQAALLALRS